MLSGNGQAVHICIVGPASTTPNMDAPDHYQTPDNIWQQNQNCHLLFSNNKYIALGTVYDIVKVEEALATT